MDKTSEDSISQSLKKYIHRTVFKEYSKFDKAHNLTHVKNVIKNSFRLCDNTDEKINILMVYTIAAYHDIGLMYGRDRHEKTSANFLLKDKKLKKWFSHNDIEIMAEAIEDHRAPSQKMPRSIYGKIISDADRDIDYINVLTRAVQYGLYNYPNYTWSQHWKRTYEHLFEKYGEKGYVTLWVDCEYNKDNLLSLQKKLHSEKTLYDDFKTILTIENNKNGEINKCKMLNEPLHMKIRYFVQM